MSTILPFDLCSWFILFFWLQKLVKYLKFDLLSLFLKVHGAKGPIFEDGPNFGMAFKLFHGKDGVVPLSNQSSFHDNTLEPEPAPQFNPLAAKAATISLSAFGLGGPFGFGSFNDKWKNQKKKSESESASKKEPSSQVDVHSLPEYN